ARYDVVLGIAGVHHLARAIRILGAAPPPTFQYSLGAALAVLCDGAGRGVVQLAHAASRRRGDADREWRPRRLPAVLPLGYRVRPRFVGQDPGPAGRLDPRWGKHDLRHLDTASPRGRMTITFHHFRRLPKLLLANPVAA